MSARKPKAQGSRNIPVASNYLPPAPACDDTVVIVRWSLTSQRSIKRDVLHRRLGEREVAILKAIGWVTYELSKASMKAFA
jgi:hypothetical protein